MNCKFRYLTVADATVIWRMLMYAAHEADLATVRAQPVLVRYAQGWGRAGDAGIAAAVDNETVGAAWLRLWPGPDKGFGWIDDTIPELAMAVVPEWQGRGIGTQLLARLLRLAERDYPAVSLNVRQDNPAVRLYHRAGFVMVEGSAMVNRTGGVSFNMLRHFDDALVCRSG